MQAYGLSLTLYACEELKKGVVIMKTREHYARTKEQERIILSVISQSQKATDVKKASNKKETLGAMTNLVIAEMWKTKNYSLKCILRGLRLGYDIVDDYNEELFNQTMLMYFSGVASASESHSRQRKMALRVLEILDIEDCFDAVFPVGLGLSFADCNHQSLQDKKYNKPIL